MLVVILSIATLFTACTTTKHMLKRTTGKVKVYKKLEIISLYDLKEYESDIELDSEMLVGFTFTEKPKIHYKASEINAVRVELEKI